MSKRILLSQGKFAIVDDADFERLNQQKWCATQSCSTWYAQRHDQDKTVYMHRAILNPPPSMECDHVNGDGLDNRRSNLRLCTRSQNQMNSGKRAGCSSIYKGVSWHKQRRKWHVRIGACKNQWHLGYFHDEHEAAAIYNAEAKKRFGEFAKLNIIENGET